MSTPSIRPSTPTSPPASNASPITSPSSSSALRTIPGEDQLLFKATTVGVFFFGEFLIIVSGEDTNLFEGKPFAKVSSPREVLLKLIYRSIFHFLEHLKIINLLSDEVEQKINRAMENRFLINLFTLQKSLVYYQNAINSNGVLIEKVRHNSSRIGFTAEELELLEDIVIENNQCYRQAEVYTNILASLMDARASIVSNNLNVLMKTLNIITISHHGADVGGFDLFHERQNPPGSPSARLSGDPGLCRGGDGSPFLLSGNSVSGSGAGLRPRFLPLLPCQKARTAGSWGHAASFPMTSSRRSGAHWPLSAGYSPALPRPA